MFFQGAGVGHDFTHDIAAVLERDRGAINKFDMVRTVLRRLNERGEPALRERREVLRRVVEFEDFSTCWPDDQLKAKGLVAEVRRVTNVKDSFTRMDSERERERTERAQAAQAAARQRDAHLQEVRSVRDALLNLFKEPDPHKRGKALEPVLNRLFKVFGVLVTQAFTLTSPEGAGITEQIDGVILFQGHHYLIEMKWWGPPLGTGDVSQHLVRVFFRGYSRGIFISASGYTDPAISTCREALQKGVIVLAHLEELVMLLERELDLNEWLTQKVDAVFTHKNPFHRPSMLG